MLQNPKMKAGKMLIDNQFKKNSLLTKEVTGLLASHQFQFRQNNITKNKAWLPSTVSFLQIASRIWKTSLYKQCIFSIETCVMNYLCVNMFDNFFNSLVLFNKIYCSFWSNSWSVNNMFIKVFSLWCIFMFFVNIYKWTSEPNIFQHGRSLQPCTQLTVRLPWSRPLNQHLCNVELDCIIKKNQ